MFIDLFADGVDPASLFKMTFSELYYTHDVKKFINKSWKDQEKRRQHIAKVRKELGLPT